MRPLLPIAGPLSRLLQGCPTADDDDTTTADDDDAAPFAAIAAGESHTCGLHADGSVACWGSDADVRASPLERGAIVVHWNPFAPPGRAGERSRREAGSA